MGISLLERIALIVQRERSFQNDYKEVNKVPNNLDYNRVLESLENLTTEVRKERLIRQKKHIGGKR
jgi:hypothetical protein